MNSKRIALLATLLALTLILANCGDDDDDDDSDDDDDDPGCDLEAYEEESGDHGMRACPDAAACFCDCIDGYGVWPSLEKDECVEACWNLFECNP
jgi:hypothetical protein